MKKIIRNTLLEIPIVLMLTIGLIGASFNILNFANGQATIPELRVEPYKYTAGHLNETFDINVTISNLDVDSQAIAANFRLLYNKTLLEVVNVTEGAFMKDTRWNLYGTYFINYTESDGIYGPHVLVGVMLIPDSATGTWTRFPAGNGTIATITFKAIYRPVEPISASCKLKLNDTAIINKDLNDIEHSTKDGAYQILSLPIPKLIVEPSVYTATQVDETFGINVAISRLDSDWKAVAVQFRLLYNSSLLEFVGVSEGAFMKDPKWCSDGTYFISYNESSDIYGPHVLVGIQLLPNATGGWANYPEGNGTLATITFKAIFKPTKADPPVSSTLKLLDTLLVDKNIESINHSVKDGYYTMVEIPVYTIEVNADVGTIHFGGELVDFYVHVSKLGQPVDASEITALLYYNGSSLVDLSAQVRHVATGLYQIPYTIPADASSGTYALVVNARYGTLQGNALKTFLISPWIEGTLKYIKDGIATIIVPNLGAIKANLTAIDAKLVSIDGKIATVQTSVGLINANLTAINAKLTSLDETLATIDSDIGTLVTNVTDIGLKVTGIVEDVATIETSLATITGKVTTIENRTAIIETNLGIVKADVSDIVGTTSNTTNLVYIAIIMSLIAAVFSALCWIYPRKK